MNQRTRKLMTMRKALNSRENTVRLYMSRKKEGGYSLALKIKSIRRLQDYIKKERRNTNYSDNTKKQDSTEQQYLETKIEKCCVLISELK